MFDEICIMKYEKMARNTTFAMEISPETSFMLKSTIKAIHKNWIWRIVGGARIPILHVRLYLLILDAILDLCKLQELPKVAIWATKLNLF